MAEQKYKNHARVDVGYLALMLLNTTLFAASLLHLGHHFDALHLILAGLSMSVLSLTIATRRYALGNQNRLIRLEENVRLHHLGVDPSGLSMRQMIALRFAPDAEVVELSKRATTERMSSKQIKEAIQDWRADHDRI